MTDTHQNRHSAKPKRVPSIKEMFTRKASTEKRDIERLHLTPRISDYEIFNQCGGVDEISFMFLANHLESGCKVSLKLTDLNLSPDYEFLEEVSRTIENNRLLKHANILPSLLSFLEGSELWTVSLPQLGTMKGIMNTHYPSGLPEMAVASILKDVLKGLQYIHENHMIHNDIRADNILIDSNGEIRLHGFRQMSILQSAGHFKHTTFSLVGDNIEWCAPEVMTQNSNFGTPADIYSLGITALELAHNKTPFDHWPPLKVLLCKQSFDCLAIKSDKTFSHSFYSFVQACVNRTPSARPTTQDLMDHPFIKQVKSNSAIYSIVKCIAQRNSESPISSTRTDSRPVTADSTNHNNDGYFDTS